MKRVLQNKNNRKKLSSFEKFQNKITNYLNQIGFKKSTIKAITSEDIIDDYSSEDVIKYIVNTPDYFIETFFDYLVACGMKKTKAKYWSTFIDIDSYTYLQRLHFIIEHVVKGYKPTTNEKYLFHPERINKWFKYEDYDFYNIPTLDECEELYAGLEMKLRDFKLYYHATSYAGALRIMQLGPKNGIGRECLDFGSTSSFYTAPDILTAKEYAKKLQRWYDGEVCIISFKILKSDLESFEFTCFSGVSRNWKDLTSDSRKCVANMLDHCEFVYGPMVANPEHVVSGKEKPRAHNPPKFQLASKKDRSDQYLYDNIHSFVWISK